MNESLSIQAVMFDLGDTLFEPLESSHIERNLASIANVMNINVPLSSLLERFASKRHELEREFSKQRFYLHRNFVESVLRSLFESLECVLPDALANQFCDAQRDAVVNYLQPREGLSETFSLLRNHGYRLAIVSNIDNEWIDPLRTKWNLDELVDLCLSSEDAQSCKPDEAIFFQACRMLGVAPTETIFVGDSQINDVAGSQRIGMHPIWFDKLRAENPRSVPYARVSSLRQVVASVRSMTEQ